MSIVLHIKGEYTGLISTMFLNVDEINSLLHFIINEGTRVIMKDMCTEDCADGVHFIDGKNDKNYFKFKKASKPCKNNSSRYLDFTPDNETRTLLKSYYFGRFGEIFKEKKPYGVGDYTWFYDDLEIYVGDRKVFESVSHEFYAAADLGGLEEKFIAYTDNSKLSNEILRKLGYAKPPEFLEGTTAAVTLKDDSLTVEPLNGGKVVFEFCKDDNVTEYNTGFLGGTPKYTGGNVALIDASPCNFTSGGTYLIEELNYSADVQGVSNLKNRQPTFCDLYLELTDADGKHCDLQISSPFIYVIIKQTH